MVPWRAKRVRIWGVGWLRFQVREVVQHRRLQLLQRLQRLQLLQLMRAVIFVMLMARVTIPARVAALVAQERVDPNRRNV